MISQSDISGRLRLLRYGLIVLVVVTFLVAWLVPYAQLAPAIRSLNDANPGLNAVVPGLFDNLGQSILITVVVAILAVIIYFVYRVILQRTMNNSSQSS
jgi:ABC-type Fe3+ transport system permease subunit